LRRKWELIPAHEHFFFLTFGQESVILLLRSVLSKESSMSKEKQAFLRQSHTQHPRPDQVRDPLFTSGSLFFDPCDLVQVKYELLRRVHVDGETVAHATRLFALSRPTFYAAEAAWQQRGIVGLLPEPPGPRQAYKLTEEIVSQLRLQAATCSSSQLVLWLEEHYQLTVHPRSIERALKRSEKKGGPS
jgi:transposase